MEIHFMIKDTYESQRKQVLDEAKEWWNNLTEKENNRQMTQGKLFDLDEARRVGQARLMDWDQVDLEQYRRRILGNHK
jgi:hypothetical protein